MSSLAVAIPWQVMRVAGLMWVTDDFIQFMGTYVGKKYQLGTKAYQIRT